VDDIVMSPRTGKIAYLLVVRGGIFGWDKQYVRVPWGDFKATTGTKLLVLGVTKRNRDDAPQVHEDQFSVHGDFGAESQKVGRVLGGTLIKVTRRDIRSIPRRSLRSRWVQDRPAERVRCRTGIRRHRPKIGGGDGAGAVLEATVTALSTRAAAG
jgi:hypothetical protein